MALFEYAGQTIGELIALEGEYKPHALVLALGDALDEKFERALGQKFGEPLASKTFDEAVEDVAAGGVVRGPLTEEELIVLALVELEAQVRNGGYSQMFHNCVYFTPMLVKALRRIGRDDVAAVTQAAIDSLKIDGPISQDAVNQALDLSNEDQKAKLGECDDQFYAIASRNILTSLWNFVKANRDKITVGPDAPSLAPPDPSTPATS